MFGKVPHHLSYITITLYIIIVIDILIRLANRNTHFVNYLFCDALAFKNPKHSFNITVTS